MSDESLSMDATMAWSWARPFSRTEAILKRRGNNLNQRQSLLARAGTRDAASSAPENAIPSARNARRLRKKVNV